jgi:hypothetical protein
MDRPVVQKFKSSIAQDFKQHQEERDGRSGTGAGRICRSRAGPGTGPSPPTLVQARIPIS